MDHESLKNLIAEVRQIVPRHRILLFGSSSLLTTFPEASPQAFGVEVTMDADFFLDPDDIDIRQSLLDSLGKHRPYHERTGYYGDFVDLRMSASFPEGWRERLVAVAGYENIFAFDPTDVAVSKIGATASTRLSRRLARSSIDRGTKDIQTVSALLKSRRIDQAILETRLRRMEWEPALIVEASRVMEEIRQLATAGDPSTSA